MNAETRMEDPDIDDELEPETEIETDPPAERQAEIEREAALMGHMPRDQFRGNPDDWIDAETFVKRGREVMPILRKNNERLLSKITELERSRLEDRKTFEDFRKFQEQALERQKADTLAQLRTARKEAIAIGDGEAFEQAEEQIRQVKSYEIPDAIKQKPPEPAPMNPIFEDWVSRNDWFNKDPALRAVADSLVEVIRADGTHEVGTPEFLEEVTRRVRAVSPGTFQNPARRAPAAVDSPAPRARKPGGKSYEDLPAEARQICDKFVNSIPGYTREAYVRDYQWS